MDYDINNQQMLRAGAMYQQTMRQQDDWQPISTAPRDGTVIEIRCTYGVAPWFGIYRWTDGTMTLVQDGKEYTFKGEPRWAKVGDDQSGFSEGPSFSWRPYKGDTASYVDPTGGAQNSMAYWRGASAASKGLPVDYFEKHVERNVSKSTEPTKRGFWSRLFGSD